MGKYWCKICSTFVDENLKKQHDASPKHKFNIQKSLRQIEKKQKEEDKLSKELWTTESKLINENNSRIHKIGYDKPKFSKGLKNKVKFKGRPKEIGEKKKEGETLSLSSWTEVEVTEEQEEASDMSTTSTMGIKRRKETASEKEMKEWDLTKTQKVFNRSDDNSDDSSDDDLKGEVVFKKRTIRR